jgi:membrane protein
MATLYHVAPNWETPWRRDLPGALLAAVAWLAAAFGLRAYVGTVLEEGVFGSLAAPIVLMLWLYVSAVALLVGAELNAELERMWPSSDAGLKAMPQPGPVARATDSTA